MTEMPRDREEALQYLMALPIGADREDAERALVDLDLWILDVGLLFSFEPEEAAEQWAKASAFATALAEGFSSWDAVQSGVVNEATQQLLWDMRERANEAYRRAQERLEESRSKA